MFNWGEVTAPWCPKPGDFLHTAERVAGARNIRANVAQQECGLGKTELRRARTSGAQIRLAFPEPFCFLADMQILAASFDTQTPKCPTCHHVLHHHGHYMRGRKGDKRSIARWFCPRCRRTFSILPRGLLPYRSVTCAELQDAFDHWAFDNRSPDARSALSALRSFLDPRHQGDLRHVFGQLLEASLETGQALWRGLRRCFGSAEEALRWLAVHTQHSLLGHYACQGPHGWSARTAKEQPATSLRYAIPHTFASQDPSLRLPEALRARAVMLLGAADG